MDNKNSAQESDSLCYEQSSEPSIDKERIQKLESALDIMIDKFDSDRYYSDGYEEYAKAIYFTLMSIEKIKEKGEKNGK